jgi:hypothetical protein
LVAVILSTGRAGEVRLWDLRSAELVGCLFAPKAAAAKGCLGACACVGVQLDDWKLVTGFVGSEEQLLEVHDIRAAGTMSASSSSFCSSWQMPVLQLQAPAKITCFQVSSRGVREGLVPVEE